MTGTGTYTPKRGDRVLIQCFIQPSLRPGDPRRIMTGEYAGVITSIRKPPPHMHSTHPQITLDTWPDFFVPSAYTFCGGGDCGRESWWHVEDIRLLAPGENPVLRWGTGDRPDTARSDTLERAVDMLWDHLTEPTARGFEFDATTAALWVAGWFAHIGYTAAGEHVADECSFCDPAGDPYTPVMQGKPSQEDRRGD